MERKSKINWWLLYLTGPFMIGLLLLEGRLQASVPVHRILEFGVMVLGFGLMAVWVQVNQAALENEEFEKEHWRLDRDPNSEPDVDPRHLPLVDVGEDSDRDVYALKGSNNQGWRN